MRFQTCLFIKGKGWFSEVVRAKDVEEALSKSISTKDTARAEYGYAHPLNQSKPNPENWRWDIRCSVTGTVTMSKVRPRKASKKVLVDHEETIFSSP